MLGIHAHPTQKLGRAGGPSTRHGLKLATFVDKTKLQAPPLAFDVGGPETIGMYANDQLGLCTCATWAGIFLHDAAAQGEAVDFDAEAVKTMYRASGWNGSPDTDNGWTLEGAADYAQRIGLVDVGGIVRKSGPWMQVDHVDLTEIQIALFMFGAMPIGVDLPLSAQDTSKPWDTDGSDDVQQKPGGWGGHSLTLIAADHAGGVFRTWGKRRPFTWRWFQRYVDEAICKVDPLWCSGDRSAPDGFLLADLLAAQTVLR